MRPWEFLVSLISVFLIFSSFSVDAQQNYSRLAPDACTVADPSTTVLGYSCNGVNRTCQTYLTFRSTPPFNTVSSISGLLAVDPLQLSQLNSVPANTTFEANRIVLVPINCSCAGQYYQAYTPHAIISTETLYSIASDVIQGLSTCQAIQAQNTNLNPNLLAPGTRIRVPLRCACPTRNQTDGGSNFLLTYTIVSGNDISTIGAIFGVSAESIAAANGINLDSPTIFPATTLLLPLQNPPDISQILQFSPPPVLPQPPSPPLSPPGPSSGGGGSNRTWVYAVVGVVGGLIVLSVAGVLIYCLFFRKKHRKADPVIASESFEAVEKPIMKLEEESAEFLESISSIAQSIQVYTFKELQAATDDFSPDCLIKGSVYRGTIKGDFAAIKKVNGDVSNEINLLSKINHLNLIRLSGVCFNDGNWYLVYEYAENGSLEDWIFQNKNSKYSPLNWRQRIQIALDVAMGLSYLHSYTSPPYVHKDINSSNILLDRDFRAKIAKFGLARATEDGEEGEFALTRHIVGTQGYMAPEYLENGLVSPKLDVYAFGVVLLEILTGKQVTTLYQGANEGLSEVLKPVIGEEDGRENLDDFMDSSLQGIYPIELAIFMVRLIDGCIKKDPTGRPDMNEVVQSLSRTITTTVSWESSVSISVYHK